MMCARFLGFNAIRDRLCYHAATEVDDMFTRTATIIFVLACSGCWATGTANNIQKDPGTGGLIRYQPGRDSWFGIVTGEEAAESKAQQLAQKNCNSGSIKILKEGDVEVSRSTIEKEVERNGGPIDKQGRSTRIISETEKRFRYKCADAPADYAPPPMDLNAVHETMQRGSTTVNINK